MRSSSECQGPYNTYDVARQIIDYAQLTHLDYVPSRRAQGFADRSTRGSGDLIGLVATLALHHEISGHRKKVCRLHLTSGCGDGGLDLAVRMNGEFQPINVKSSRFSPVRPSLHLYVKEEEIDKPVFGYLQAFVHLDRGRPHIHVPGGCSVLSRPWTRHGSRIIEIPNTGGHCGVGVPLSELNDLEALIALIDDRW